MLDFDNARQQLLAAADIVPATETVALSELNGRLLAEPVFAGIAVPPEDNSAMDGIAFAFADLPDDGCLNISAKLFAGYPQALLQTNTAARLFTGSVIPEGADTVVLQEDCQFDYDGDGELVNVKVLETPKKGQHIRRSGEDIAKGAQVVAAKTRLTPRHIGLLASVGISDVLVYQPVKVGLLATGDELVTPGQPLNSGQIYNSNLALLTAQLQELGCLVDARHIHDDLDAITAALADMALTNNVLLTIGGVSVGDADFVKLAIERMGELQLWKVAMKPGKPLSFGRLSLPDNSSVPLIGLPGNPVSAFATFQLFALPFIFHGITDAYATMQDKQYPVKLNKTLQPRREEFLRVQLVQQQGEEYLLPYSHQGSGVLSSVAWADGFARIPLGKATKSGDKVAYIPFV